MMGKDMGVIPERNASLENRIEATDKTALVRGLFRKYAPEPKYGTKDDKHRFKGWSDIDSFDAMERCVSASKAVAKVNEAIVRLTGEPEELEGTSYCSECKLTFFSATHFRYHKLFIANEKNPENDNTIVDTGSSDPSTGMLFCPWCPLLLQGPLALLQHMKVCREKKNHPSTLRLEVSEDFFCSDCQKLFDREDDLWRHVYVVHGLPYKCNRCPEQFTSKKQFKTHIVTCSGEENPKCSDCHMMFPQRRELLRHVTLTPHCKLAEPYVCEKCHIALNNRKLMLTHLWKHVRTFRTRSDDYEPSVTSAPVKNEPFDPFRVPDFFKPRPALKPPESGKSPEKRHDHLNSPESTKRPAAEKTSSGLKTPDLLQQTESSEPFQGFDDHGPNSGDETTENRVTDVICKIPNSQIGNKKIIGFILDHPYSLPCSDQPKRVKKKKSSCTKKPSPSKKSESNSSSKKKGENNKEEKSKTKSDSTLSKKESPCKQKSSQNVGKDLTKKPPMESTKKRVRLVWTKRRVKTTPKKMAMGGLVEAPSAEIVAVPSALPQEGPSPWEDDVGMMPMIQSVTSIHDWNALPDASEPLSPIKKRKKKKKKAREASIDENVKNILKATGQDPSGYEFVFLSDSDDREMDGDSGTGAEGGSLQVEEPTPVQKPSFDGEPLLIPIDGPEPMPVHEKISNVNPVSNIEPVKVAQLVPFADPVQVFDPVQVVEPVKVVQPVQVIEPDQVVEPVRVIEPDQVVEPVQVIEPDQVVEPVQVIEPDQVVEPVKVIQPGQVVEPVQVVKPVMANEPVSVNQMILTDEPILVEEPPFVGHPSFVENLQFLEESTIPEDAVLLPLPADTNTISNKSTKVTKSQKDVISNYDNIPMFLPHRNNLTDVCLIDPWDASIRNNTVKVGKLIKSRKQPLAHVTGPPVVFETTIQPEPHLPAIEQLNKLSFHQRKSLPPGSSEYLVWSGNTKTKQWIPLASSLSSEAIPPLMPIGANTKDTVVANSLHEMDLGLLSLALAAEALANRRTDKLVTSTANPVGLGKCGNSRALGGVDKQRQLVPYRQPKTTVTRLMIPSPKDGLTLLYNKNNRGARMTISSMLVPLPAPITRPSVDELGTVIKDSAGSLGKKHRPPGKTGSFSSLLKMPSAAAESSQKSIPAASANLRAELKSGEECTTPNSLIKAKVDQTLEPEDKGNAPSFDAGSPPEAGSLNDDDFPEELNESDWDFDNPVSPSYSFVDDGDDYSPVNAHSDSFMNNSSGNSSPERASTPGEVPLVDVKVVLTRLDEEPKKNLEEASEEASGSETKSEVVSRNVCPDCGRSFKTESGCKIHRARCCKSSSSVISSCTNKNGSTPKVLPASPGKSLSLDERKMIQAELSDLSSSLNDILPGGRPEESYKPVEGDGKTSKRPQFTCDCCNRTFKFSLALNVHRSKMMLKAAAKNKMVEAESAVMETKAVSEPGALETIGFDSSFLGDTLSESWDGDEEDVDKLIQILDQDLELSKKDSQQNEEDGEVYKESDSAKTAEEVVHPATSDKSAGTPESEPVAKREETPSCADNIVVDVSKVIEATQASCKISSAGEAKGMAESVAPKPSTVTIKSNTIGPGGGERPVYVCSYCYRKFFNQTSLKIHLTWEKKREKRKRALQEFVPKVTFDGEIKLVGVREGAERSANKSQRSASARKSSNEASLKICASSKRKRERSQNGHPLRTSVDPTHISESAVEWKTSSKLVSKPTTAPKLDSEASVDSKVFSEAADRLKANCELKTVPNSSVGSHKLLDLDYKEVINNKSITKPESEDQFFADISKKILIAVESELKAHYPLKDNSEDVEESKIAPSEDVLADPTKGSTETGVPASTAQEISEVSADKVKFSKTATPMKATSRKMFRSPKKSPFKQRAETFKISRSGRHIKKKKRFGVDDNFGFIPRALKNLIYKKPPKQVGDAAVSSFDMPAATEVTLPVATGGATLFATQETKAIATPVAMEVSTPVTAEVATSVTAEVATSVTAEVATSVTAEVATPIGPENALGDTTKDDELLATDEAIPVLTEVAVSEGAAMITAAASEEQPADGSARRFQCKNCFVWFAFKQQLGGHMRGCIKKHPHSVKFMKSAVTCGTCKAIFKTHKQLLTHIKLKISCRKSKRGNSDVALGSSDASLTISSEGVVDEVTKGKRAKFSCKVCGRVFRNERSLRAHKWQRLKRGSSGTFCVPISIKSVRSDANERGTTQPCETPNLRKAGFRRRRRGLRKKMWGHRKEGSAPGNVSVDAPGSASANNEVSQQIFDCKVCARTFESHWSLNAHKKKHSANAKKRFFVMDTKKDSTDVSTAAVEPVAAPDDDSDTNIYPCTCFRVFSSLKSLNLHRLNSDHPDSLSLQTAENKTAIESADLAKKYSCDTCGREFSTTSALGLHKFRAVKKGGKFCTSLSETPAEARGEGADDDNAAEVPADCASGEGSFEASFESAKDVSSDVSFTSAKGDEPAELPAESAMGEARAEASVEVLSSTKKDTPNVLTCQLCHRRFPSVRSLKMHLIHQKRRGFCGMDTSATILDDTATSSSLLVENDDTSDSSVAPSLPMDETSLAFDPKNGEDSVQLSLKDDDDFQRDDLSESSSLQTSEGDSKSENRRSRSSKGKKVAVLKSLYQCDLCSLNYSYLKSLFRHVETVHGNGDLKCDGCGMTFHSVQGLQIHVMTKETKLFKSAFEPVKANEVADEQASSSKGEFAEPQEESCSENHKLTEATTKPQKRKKMKLTAEEVGALSVNVVVNEAGTHVVPQDKSGLTAICKPGKLGKRERNSDGMVAAEENSAVPTSEVPTKRRRRRRKGTNPIATEEDLTANVDARKKTRICKMKSEDAAEEKSTLLSSVQETPRKRKRRSKDQITPGGEINPSAETPKTDLIGTEDIAMMTVPAENVKLEVESLSGEKLKPKTEALSDGKQKPEASPEDQEKRKPDDLENPSVLLTPEHGSPARKRSSAKTAKTESDSEVPQSPSTPSRTLRSNAKATPSSDPDELCCPTPTRTVTFILSFQKKHVRFVSLKCYPQQPPNPIVHCSMCKQCMMKEQIEKHDCESNHFICMCQKCRLHFPYDQFTLMASNSKKRLSASSSSPERDAKLQTCGTCFSETKAWESHVQLDTCSPRSPLMADCGLDRPGNDETCAPKTDEEQSQHPCDSPKTSFESLAGHLCSRVAASPRKLFRCNSCSRWFQNEFMLRAHKKGDSCNE